MGLEHEALTERIIGAAIPVHRGLARFSRIGLREGPRRGPR